MALPAATAQAGGRPTVMQLLPTPGPTPSLCPSLQPSVSSRPAQIHESTSVTMRHIMKVIQGLLEQHQTYIAINLLEELSTETLLSPSLDMPVAGAWELSAQLQSFMVSERTGAEHLFNDLDSWATQMPMVGGSISGSDLSYKMSRMSAECGSHNHSPKSDEAAPGTSLLSSLGLTRRRGTLKESLNALKPRQSQLSVGDTLNSLKPRQSQLSMGFTHGASVPLFNKARSENSAGQRRTHQQSFPGLAVIPDMGRQASKETPVLLDEESSDSMEDVPGSPTAAASKGGSSSSLSVPSSPSGNRSSAQSVSTNRGFTQRSNAPQVESAQKSQELAMDSDFEIRLTSGRRNTWPVRVRNLSEVPVSASLRRFTWPSAAVSGASKDVPVGMDAQDPLRSFSQREGSTMSLVPTIQISRTCTDGPGHERSPVSQESLADVPREISAERLTAGNEGQRAKHRRAAISKPQGAAVFMDDLEEDKAVYLSTPTHKFIIHPSNNFRMSWDVASLFIILMEAVILPLGLCFGAYPPDAIMWISTFFFTPDTFLNFFTGFYQNGILVMRHSVIVQRYVLGWFSVDFFSTMPWELLLSKEQGQASFMLKFAKIGKLMRVLRLLRILKLRALLHRVEDMFSSYIVLFLLSITKTLLAYAILCHWTACFWGWLGSYDGSSEPYVKTTCEPDGPCENGIGVDDSPWRRRYGMDTYAAISQYLVSLQFATGLMTGAELQMSPGWWLERMFVIIMMMVSFLICSIIISQIVVVMEKINQDNSEYLEQTRVIRDFMVSRGMPIRLQTKVKRYLEYQFKNRKVVHQNHEVIMKLSPFLRVEITEHMNKAILEHHPFFAGMEASVLSQVCCLARSVLYAPGDIMMRKGQLSSLIAFVVRGQLLIRDVREGVSIYVKPPAWVGDPGLFVTSELAHTFTCSTHTEVLTIHQQDLIELVREIPSAEAYIKMYCQKVLDKDATVTFCPSCRMAGHDLKDCEDLDELVERMRPGAHPKNIVTHAKVAHRTTMFGSDAVHHGIMGMLRGITSKNRILPADLAHAQ